jgi:hypothetical protein
VLVCIGVNPRRTCGYMCEGSSGNKEPFGSREIE